MIFSCKDFGTCTCHLNQLAVNCDERFCGCDRIQRAARESTADGGVEDTCPGFPRRPFSSHAHKISDMHLSNISTFFFALSRATEWPECR